MGKSGTSRINFFSGVQSSVTLELIVGLVITTLLQCEISLDSKLVVFRILLQYPPAPRVDPRVNGRAIGKSALASPSPELQRCCRDYCEPNLRFLGCAP